MLSSGDSDGRHSSAICTTGSLTADVPPLRTAESEQAALVQTLRIRVDDCAREKEQVSQALERLTNLLGQIELDEAREATLKQDAQKALSELQSELDKSQNGLQESTPKLEAARIQLEDAQASSRDADEQAAKSQARLVAAQQNKAQLSSRLNELDRRIAAAQSSLEQLNLEELREQVELSAKVLSANEAELSRLEAAMSLLKPG